MRIMIIRHGDPDYSIDSLTEKGWREARLLAAKLVKQPAAAYYCSPLGRARDTASLTLQALGREAETCEWLREFAPRIQRPDRDGGESIAWDWLPQDWTVRDVFLDRDAWLTDPIMAHSKVPEEYAWVCRELDALIEKHGYKREGRSYKAVTPNQDTLVFFCHFGLECVLLSHLLNMSPMTLWHGTCAAPSSVTTLVTEERRQGIAYFRMSSFGDISHLYAADEPPAFSARFCECFSNTEERHD